MKIWIGITVKGENSQSNNPAGGEPVPGTGTPPAGLFDWLFSPFTVMPIQIFNWTSRPDPAFHQNAAAASFVLVIMTLGMNGLAIWLRYRLRKNIKW